MGFHQSVTVLFCAVSPCDEVRIVYESKRIRIAIDSLELLEKFGYEEEEEYR